MLTGSEDGVVECEGAVLAVLNQHLHRAMIHCVVTALTALEVERRNGLQIQRRPLHLLPHLLQRPVLVDLLSDELRGLGRQVGHHRIHAGHLLGVQLSIELTF